ncbi:hypothetical protein COW36_06540, partial [bacterium (Candidatus Blackallbacteria) CG17_big_fil_post_rev_8_21_14_2_50_48_46]
NEGRTLRLKMDGDVYEITKHKGMSAYTTGQLVKKTLVPLRAHVDKIVAKAIRAMNEEDYKAFAALQKDTEDNPANEEKNQAAAAELLKIPGDEYMEAETAAWEQINPDASAQLVKALFQTVLAEGTGYLNSIEAIDKHFDPDIKPQRMSHFDILRSEVIKFNSFLDNQRSPLS